MANLRPNGGGGGGSTEQQANERRRRRIQEEEERKKQEEEEQNQQEQSTATADTTSTSDRLASPGGQQKTDERTRAPDSGGSSGSGGSSSSGGSGGNGGNGGSGGSDRIAAPGGQQRTDDRTRDPSDSSRGTNGGGGNGESDSGGGGRGESSSPDRIQAPGGRNNKTDERTVEVDAENPPGDTGGGGPRMGDPEMSGTPVEPSYDGLESRDFGRGELSGLEDTHHARTNDAVESLTQEVEQEYPWLDRSDYAIQREENRYTVNFNQEAFTQRTVQQLDEEVSEEYPWLDDSDYAIEQDGDQFTVNYREGAFDEQARKQVREQVKEKTGAEEVEVFQTDDGRYAGRPDFGEQPTGLIETPGDGPDMRNRDDGDMTSASFVENYLESQRGENRDFEVKKTEDGSFEVSVVGSRYGSSQRRPVEQNKADAVQESLEYEDKGGQHSPYGSSGILAEKLFETQLENENPGMDVDIGRTVEGGITVEGFEQQAQLGDSDWDIPDEIPVVGGADAKAGFRGAGDTVSNTLGSGAAWVADKAVIDSDSDPIGDFVADQGINPAVFPGTKDYATTGAETLSYGGKTLGEILNAPQYVVAGMEGAEYVDYATDRPIPETTRTTAKVGGQRANQAAEYFSENPNELVGVGLGAAVTVPASAAAFSRMASVSPRLARSARYATDPLYTSAKVTGKAVKGARRAEVPDSVSAQASRVGSKISDINTRTPSVKIERDASAGLVEIDPELPRQIRRTQQRLANAYRNPQTPSGASGTPSTQAVRGSQNPLGQSVPSSLGTRGISQRVAGKASELRQQMRGSPDAIGERNPFGQPLPRTLGEQAFSNRLASQYAQTRRAVNRYINQDGPVYGEQSPLGQPLPASLGERGFGERLIDRASNLRNRETVDMVGERSPFGAPISTSLDEPALSTRATDAGTRAYSRARDILRTDIDAVGERNPLGQPLPASLGERGISERLFGMRDLTIRLEPGKPPRRPERVIDADDIEIEGEFNPNQAEFDGSMAGKSESSASTGDADATARSNRKSGSRQQTVVEEYDGAGARDARSPQEFEFERTDRVTRGLQSIGVLGGIRTESEPESAGLAEDAGSLGDVEGPAISFAGPTVEADASAFGVESSGIQAGVDMGAASSADFGVELGPDLASGTETELAVESYIESGLESSVESGKEAGREGLFPYPSNQYGDKDEFSIDQSEDRWYNPITKLGGGNVDENLFGVGK